MENFNTNVIHVIPVDDIMEHNETTVKHLGIPVSKCACSPKVQLDIDSGGWIVIHGAFDGREALEEVNEILGNTKPTNP